MLDVDRNEIRADIAVTDAYLNLYGNGDVACQKDKPFWEGKTYVCKPSVIACIIGLEN